MANKAGLAQCATAGAETPDVRCDRAALLDASGRTDEARQLYLAILATAPDHAATLNNLGALLYRTGYRTAARTAFLQAVACHPALPHAHVQLGNLLREDGAFATARAHYEAALAAAPNFAEAHQGLGGALAGLGDHAAAADHWRRGYRNNVFSPCTYRGVAPPVRVLLLFSVAGGNIPVRAFLDDTVFAPVAVAMEFYTSSHTLPPHDLVLNTIGDADLCRDALKAAIRLLRRTNAPVINHPVAVLATGRVANAHRFAAMPGVRAPRTVRIARHRLVRELARRGSAWPVLLRTPGFHTGQHFVRVDNEAALPEAVASLPGDDVLAIEYLDADGGDGFVRKGRVMIIGGRLFPLHWAASPHWKVHYFTAGMVERAAHRAEEACFLADMNGFIGTKAVASLQAIAARLGLEYGGIDFALSPSGEILLFEANATMALVAPGADAIWDYRRAAIDAAADAMRNMLKKKAKEGPLFRKKKQTTFAR